MLKSCPTCNVEFESDSLRQKYCSEECRLERVREYDRLRKQKERAEEREIRDRDNLIQLQARKEVREKNNQEINESREQELMARVNDGDPLAIMHTTKPFGVEYWEAYQQYEIDYAERWNRTSTRTVNGVSVYEPEFPEKVIETTKELGHIASNM